MTDEKMPPDRLALLTPAEVSAFLRIPIRTLAHWRSQRTGPLAIRVGAHVRYLRSDLEEWIKAQSATARKDRLNGAA